MSTVLKGIGWAVKEMQGGARVARRGWPLSGQHLALQIPDQNSKMTEPYIYITRLDGSLVPWVAPQANLLAIDWYVVK